MPRVVADCQFSPITPDEVISVIKGFGAKRRGINSIQPAIMQLVSIMVAPFLSDIFNGCILLGMYPDVLKTARIVPLYKSGDSSSPSNYRPISTLCIFNKIFEKLIQSRLSNFLDEMNILSNKQFGFKKNTSTTHAIFTLISELQRSFNKKTYTICLFLDLKKAFDTVNRDLLLHKLDHYGFRNNIGQLIRSYFTNRAQYVNISNCNSSTKSVPLGVLQGSVLGPLMFSTFINDITELGVNSILFADDAVFFVESNTLHDAVIQMQSFIGRLSVWLNDNRLTAHEDKTKLMLFTPCQKPPLLPSIIFNRTILEWVDEIKYLGIIIDTKLQFKSHINFVENKLSIIQGITYSLKKLLPVHCLRTIFFALAYPHIVQNIIIWGGAPTTSIRPIAIKMNKILRNILNVRFDAARRPIVPTNNMYKALNILKLEDIYEFQLLKFIVTSQQSDDGIWTKYFSNLRPIHNYSTRRTGLNIPNIRTNVERASALFQCVRAYNSLPATFNIENMDAFKIQYKFSCLSEY